MESQAAQVLPQTQEKLEHILHQPQQLSSEFSSTSNFMRHGDQVSIIHKAEENMNQVVNCKKNVHSKTHDEKFRRGDYKQKLLSYKIKKQFKEYAVKTPRIIDCIKSISKQIKDSLLRQSFSPQNNIPQATQQTNQPKNICQMNSNKGIVSFQTVEDQDVIRQNELRKLLVPSSGDNDLSSDDEDLRKGMTYLFRELVHSVGENYQQNKINKEMKEKKKKVRQSNKQNNFNTNNIQLSSKKQKKEFSKANNSSQHSSIFQKRINLIKN